MPPGRFFDGETAAEHSVSVLLAERALIFEGPTVVGRMWPLTGLIHAGGRPEAGEPLRLAHETAPAARLFIDDAAFARQVIAAAPQAGGALTCRRAAKATAFICLAVFAAAVALYAVLALAPRTVAGWIPEPWRERLGAQIERSFVGEANACGEPRGTAALSRLEARLREGGSLPDFSVRIFDMPIVNAFALPGGRIVVSDALIQRAGAPDQVAGVIAHELGHVAHRDPEAQLIRAAGLQIVIALFTGGANDTVADLAGTLAILRYSREAERAADTYAVGLMRSTRIDPLALRRFFQILEKEEEAAPGASWGRLTGLLATHPLTKERIDAIEPLTGGAPRDVMTAEEWNDLRSICG
jgi:beta-barrel assembly-enhancing protease